MSQVSPPTSVVLVECAMWLKSFQLQWNRALGDIFEKGVIKYVRRKKRRSQKASSNMPNGISAYVYE
jgi:hypothetical protein